MRRNIIPDVVSEQNVATLPGGASVREAARIMKERRISSVLITEADKLQGIFTVRDVTRRVVADDLDPDTTPLAQVMTENPETVPPDDVPVRALRRMQEGGFRHLPVVTGDQVVGIVSRRDFFAEEEAQLEKETHLWEHCR